MLRSGLSPRVPECQKINKGGLDQYGTEQFGRIICGTERVKMFTTEHLIHK